MANIPPDPRTLPYWLSQRDDLAHHRTTSDLHQDVDTIIIGSGYTGAATAYHILKQPNHRPSTVILEAREVCSGATGRNGGHLKPDLYAGWSIYEKAFGPTAAASITKFEIQQVMEVKRLVEQEQIDCDFTLTRAIDVFVDKTQADPMIAAYKAMRDSGVNEVGDLSFISDPQKAENFSGVKGALAAFSYTAASVWPYKLVCGLLRRCIEWGANLQTGTVVLSVSQDVDPDGYRIVQTSRGTIRAKAVVFATNAYTAGLLPEFRDKITPVRGTAVRIAVPEGGVPPHLNNTYCIRFAPKEYDYLIPRPDGSIVVGGAKQVLLKQSTLWQHNLNDAELIPGVAEYFGDYMQRTFHGWEGSNAQITDIWTGIMGYSDDIVPFVGELPAKPGVYVIAGFTGHGMPRILGCAAAVAALVRGDRNEMNESCMPSPFWITKERLEASSNMVEEYMSGSRRLRQVNDNS